MRQYHAGFGQHALRHQITWRYGGDDATQPMSGRAVCQQPRDCFGCQADTPVGTEEGVFDLWLKLPTRMNQAGKANYGA